MPMRFLDQTQRIGSPPNYCRPGEVGSLYGKPFPSEEVAAFFALVPDMYVLMVEQTGSIVVHSRNGRRAVMSMDRANDLTAWQELVASFADSSLGTRHP